MASCHKTEPQITYLTNGFGMIFSCNTQLTGLSHKTSWFTDLVKSLISSLLCIFLKKINISAGALKTNNTLLWKSPPMLCSVHLASKYCTEIIIHECWCVWFLFMRHIIIIDNPKRKQSNLDFISYHPYRCWKFPHYSYDCFLLCHNPLNITN